MQKKMLRFYEKSSNNNPPHASVIKCSVKMEL